MLDPSPKSSEGQDRSIVRKKWRPFRAMDFETLMYPCFLFCRIIGLFPYTINGSTVVLTKRSYITSTLSMIGAGIWGVIVLFEVNIAGDISFDGVPGALQCNCYYILGGVIAVITYIMIKPRIDTLQIMLDVSSKLPAESYRKMSKVVHAKDILGFLFIVIQLYQCFVNSYNFGDTFLKLMTFYLTILVFQMDMLYMDCVCVLKACFAQLNDSLLNLRELVVNDEPHLLRRTYHEQRNPHLLMELKALKKRHLMISDAVHLVNKVFSMQILTTIVMTFAEITFGLYFYIVVWQEGTDVINLEKQIWIKYYITSVTYYSIKIVLIVWACDTGKDNALQIGTTVHDVLISTSDKQIKEELQLFSLQILHRENSFNAKGLVVDATLLTGIVGSITTYLLILIQFLVTKQVCIKK
ncbi:Putative gustatory receptor 28b [Cyphomyrmex costatus]|uniref:Gustatory receptor n=1 Tax=Cyphomyrmex costatus TaxID=456900 RepID=A0A195CXX0_9HYME|nr:Putative gustatory receptor 28b [Cyphomyrmex costatus]